MRDTFQYIRYKIRHSLPRGNAPKIIITLFLVLALPVGIFVAQQAQQYRTDAALEAVSLSFSPAQQNLPPDSNFKIIADAKSNQIGFLKIEFSIDNSKVNLVNDITVTSRLATVIQKSTMAEINSTGQGVIVAALSPADRANPLTGVFEFANFNIKSVTAQPDAATTLSFNTTDIQIIDMQSQKVPYTSQQASLILNKTAISTSVPTTNAVSSSPTITFIPVATSIPTTAPTNFVATPTTATALTTAPTSVVSTIAPTSAPTSTQAPKVGDVNGDGSVNTTDIAIIVDAYGSQPPSDMRADLNKDGQVNIIDVGIVIDNYGL
jgi:hypothetical protein